MSLSQQLDASEEDIVKTLRTLLKVDGKSRFSSDDFRRYGLDRFLRGDPTHSIGGFFQKLLKQDLVREVGRVRSLLPSNHFREIRVYVWTDGGA